MTSDTIFGRDEELGIVAGFLDGDVEGIRFLLLEGDAGIGKSTLWNEAVRLTESKGPVLVARASQAEAKLSFTVLADLLQPAIAEVAGALPAPQRRALEAALLLEDPEGASPPDARAVSVATHGALRALAGRAAITVAIDDVQWADGPSARALAFALRRLGDEPVTVVAAMRKDRDLHDPLELATMPGGLTRLPIGPVDVSAIGSMLRRRFQRRFPRPLVVRIHDMSGGNPFFALEIGRTLGGDDALLNPRQPLPVPSDLRQLLRRRLTVLPRSALEALLLAASSAHPTFPLVHGIQGGAAGLAEAESAEIIRVHGTEIEFTHPLFASTVYEIASARDRRTAHAALAKAVREPEERARHLALSSAGPSAEAAVALEGAGDHAVTRGAPLAAAELYRLAATITPVGDTEGLRRRRLRSAQTLFAAGDAPGARELIERMLADPMPGPDRAQAMYSLSFMSWNDVTRVKPLLEQALEDIGENDFIRGLILADLAWVEVGGCDPTSAIPWARAAVELADEVKDPFLLRTALAVLAMAEAILGRDAEAHLARGISEEGTLAYGEVTTARTCLGRLQLWKGALDEARDTLDVELVRYLEQGHESASWDVRAYLAEVEFRAGRWPLAAEHSREAHEIVVEAGWIDVLGEVVSVEAAIEAAMGRIPEARADGADALAVCQRTGDRWNEIKARAALGFLELSLGDAAEANRWLAPATEITNGMDLQEPGAFPFVPDRVEALVALGELGSAERLTDRLDEQGRALDRSMALATAARCRGLIAAARGDLEGAEEHLRRSLDEHERTQQPFELGRTQLVAGAVSRRMKQKKGARDLLQRALAAFDDLGAPLWADRVRRELARIGGRVPTGTGLTPTETQIAHLVAEGRTNREVADALFVSVHTVEANLTRVYRKLGVRSRTQLARKL